MPKWVHRLVSVDVEANQGECANCGPVQLAWRSMRGVKVPRCSVAIKLQKGMRGRRKPDGSRKSRQPYGLTLGEADEFKRGKVCAICSADTRLCVDHCHKTGKIRGVLCASCNWMIGHAREDVAVLESAILYLQIHKDPAYPGDGE